MQVFILSLLYIYSKDSLSVIRLYSSMRIGNKQKGRDIRRIPKHEDKLLIFISLKYQTLNNQIQ